MSVLLIGALGLAIDGGQIFAQREMAQTAADAAAQAGIMAILKGTNATSANPFGTGSTPIASSACAPIATDPRTPCVYARLNGFGTAADTVTLSFPASVAGATLSAVTVPAFTVTVQRVLQSGLMRFFGAGATTVTAKATAGMIGSVSPNCIYVLDPAAANAFQATNGASVVVNGCGVIIDSSNNVAVDVIGGSTFSASAINIVGGITVGGGSTVSATTIQAGGTVSVTGGSSISPAPAVVTMPPVADPFASVPTPATGACDFTNYNPGFGTWTLNPGTYCGGITISNGATATFNPGVYVINGGGVTLVGGTTDTGSGVMFYLTGTNATYASVTISNGANVTFSAPTSGPYLGLVFYQDRAITSASNATFSGGVAMKITGTLYFKTTSVVFSNGSTTATYSTAIVAKQVSFSGGTNIKYDATGQKTGLFSKAAALVQ